MEEEMTLKEFVETLADKNPFQGINILVKLIELESIENYLNAMYGIKLEIKVKPAEKKEGRYYGKSVIDSLK